MAEGQVEVLDPTEDAGAREFVEALAGRPCERGTHQWPNERQAGWCNCGHMYYPLHHNQPPEKLDKAPAFILRGF